MVFAQDGEARKTGRAKGGSRLDKDGCTHFRFRRESLELVVVDEAVALGVGARVFPLLFRHHSCRGVGNNKTRMDSKVSTRLHHMFSRA
jgi:hypothetical protein